MGQAIQVADTLRTLHYVPILFPEWNTSFLMMFQLVRG